jgi:hypothetical protein
MNAPVSGFLFASLLLMASLSPGQSPPKVQPQVRKSPTLTTQESSLMRNTALADARVQQVVGAGQTRVLLGEAVPDKAEAIAFFKGETQKPPTHHVWATIFNPKTNKAAEVFIALEQNTILKVQEIKAIDVPLTREDVDEALALAKASPDVRRAVGNSVDQFVVLDPGNTQTVPLEAQSLRVRSVDPNDPCTLDRCLDLIFKTGTGYLPLRAAVDLTKHTVTLRTSPGKGKHP